MHENWLMAPNINFSPSPCMDKEVKLDKIATKEVFDCIYRSLSTNRIDPYLTSHCVRMV